MDAGRELPGGCPYCRTMTTTSGLAPITVLQDPQLPQYPAQPRRISEATEVGFARTRWMLAILLRSVTLRDAHTLALALRWRLCYATRMEIPWDNHHAALSFLDKRR